MAINLDNDAEQTTGKPGPPMVVLSGQSGVGKTTFAAGAENCVFIQTEAGEGLLKITRIKFDADKIATKYSQVTEAIEALQNQEHDYKTLVIDSIDHLEPLMWEHLCTQNNWPAIDRGGAGYGVGYATAAGEWRVLLKKLIKLRKTKGMAIVLIAHCQTRNIDEPGESQITRWDLKLHAKSSAVITETVDCVFFAKHKVRNTTEDTGYGGSKTIQKDMGQRVLVTQGGPHLNAKNRYGLPPEIPLSWADFMSALGDSIKSTTKEKVKANG